MKKIYSTIILLSILLLTCITINAQTQLNIVKNDSLIVEMEGYKQGTITWQRSANKTSWTALTAGRNSEELRTQITTPYYFRSKIDDGTCDPVYSDTIQVNQIESFEVNAGHGYAESEPFVSSSGITMRENGTLSSWSNPARKAVWFLYHRAGTDRKSTRLNSSH